MKGDVLDGELLGFSTSGDSSPDSHYWTVTATLLADVVPYLIEGKATLELSQLSVKKEAHTMLAGCTPNPPNWELFGFSLILDHGSSIDCYGVGCLDHMHCCFNLLWLAIFTVNPIMSSLG